MYVQFVLQSYSLKNVFFSFWKQMHICKIYRDLVFKKKDEGNQD